jgi:predicted RNase H-like HicB family nuclease
MTTTGKKPSQSARGGEVRFTVEYELEDDGRWIAEIPEVPGALAYGKDKDEALRKAYAIALHAVADDVEKSDADFPNSIQLLRHSA